MARRRRSQPTAMKRIAVAQKFAHDSDASTRQCFQTGAQILSDFEAMRGPARIADKRANISVVIISGGDL